MDSESNTETFADDYDCIGCDDNVAVVFGIGNFRIVRFDKPYDNLYLECIFKFSLFFISHFNFFANLLALNLIISFVYLTNFLGKCNTLNCFL